MPVSPVRTPSARTNVYDSSFLSPKQGGQTVSQQEAAKNASEQKRKSLDNRMMLSVMIPPTIEEPSQDLLNTQLANYKSELKQKNADLRLAGELGQALLKKSTELEQTMKELTEQNARLTEKVKANEAKKPTDSSSVSKLAQDLAQAKQATFEAFHEAAELKRKNAHLKEEESKLQQSHVQFLNKLQKQDYLLQEREQQLANMNAKDQQLQVLQHQLEACKQQELRGQEEREMLAQRIKINQHKYDIKLKEFAALTSSFQTQIEEMKKQPVAAPVDSDLLMELRRKIADQEALNTELVNRSENDNASAHALSRNLLSKLAQMQKKESELKDEHGLILERKEAMIAELTQELQSNKSLFATLTVEQEANKQEVANTLSQLQVLQGSHDLLKVELQEQQEKNQTGQAKNQELALRLQQQEKVSEEMALELQASQLKDEQSVALTLRLNEQVLKLEATIAEMKKESKQRQQPAGTVVVVKQEPVENNQEDALKMGKYASPAAVEVDGADPWAAFLLTNKYQPDKKRKTSSSASASGKEDMGEAKPSGRPIKRALSNKGNSISTKLASTVSTVVATMERESSLVTNSSFSCFQQCFSLLFGSSAFLFCFFLEKLIASVSLAFLFPSSFHQAEDGLVAMAMAVAVGAGIVGSFTAINFFGGSSLSFF